MEIKITMKVTDLMRDLAGQYAASLMTTDEYLDALEELMRVYDNQSIN